MIEWISHLPLSFKVVQARPLKARFNGEFVFEETRRCSVEDK